MKGMRVILLIESTAMQIGGGEISSSFLANKLTKMGHSVAFITPSLHAGVVDMLDDSIQIVQLSSNSHDFAIRLPRILLILKLVPRLLRTAIGFGPDIVCAGSEVMGIVALFLKYVLRVPVILFKQFGVFEDWTRLAGRTAFLMEMIERKLLRLPYDAILTNNISIKAALREKVPVEKLFLRSLQLMPLDALSASQIKAPILDDTFSPTDIVLLFAGRLERVKGLHVLIDALAHLPASFKLLVLGRGSEMDCLRQQAIAQGLEDRIVFLGQVPYLEVSSYILFSDLVVCPSISELKGAITMWDAFLLRKPVVATCVGDIPKLIKNGIHAAIVPPDDSMALSRAISRTVKDSRGTTAMINQAYQLAKEQASSHNTLGFLEACRYVLRKQVSEN